MLSLDQILNIWIFCFGTLVGSFINVCIYRLPRKQSIVGPGSFCQTCGTPLSWWQNIPIISYLILRGRCAYCSSPYRADYFWIEVLFGFLTLALYLKFKAEIFSFIFYYLFMILLVIVFFIDLKHWLILDEVVYLGMGLGLIIFVAGMFGKYQAHDFKLWLLPVWGAAVGFGLFYLIAVLGSWVVHQEAMGFGDVKFAALIGWFLGPQKALLAFLLAFLSGGGFALFYLLIKRKGGKEPVPFGTFMALGSLITVFYGDSLIKYFFYSAIP
jgi:leader peptidase (prepilin peptidase) / N-methyltransferase